MLTVQAKIWTQNRRKQKKEQVPQKKERIVEKQTRKEGNY